MSLRLRVTALAYFIFAVALAEAITTTGTSSTCQRCCGEGKRHRNCVPYPFGFSGGCVIRLNCSKNGDIKIGELPVENVTSEYILVNLPANCSRPISQIGHFFSGHYAMSWRNSLLFQKCDSKFNGCVIPSDVMQSRFHIPGCESMSDNISCYSEKNRGTKFMDHKNLNPTGCKILVSSIVIDFDTNTEKNSGVTLVFQMVELGWWLNGDCKCVDNADCETVPLDNRAPGFRCRCKEGFEGDGFIHGAGCRPVADCDMSGRCEGTSKVGIIVGGVVAGASLIIVLALLFFCCRRRSITSKRRMSPELLLCEAAGSYSIPIFSYKDIGKATNGFSEKHRLGTGAYGTVYEGKLHDDGQVAIKKIRHRDADGIEQVINEIKLLSSVSHPNIVRLLGCCIENGEQILVYEFMPNGTLSQHLQRERDKCIPWTIRLTIATETAHAIAHLHSALNPPIYHRDIKSSNILLDYNFNSKVADFGLSRLGMTDDSHISTAPQGTPGYVDPQYHQNYHLSDKSDVYSFGVVLVEIITALKVVDFTRPHSETNLAALAIDRIGKGRIDEIIDAFLDPHRDPWTLSSIHKVAELAFRCLAFHRDMRPSMIEVADELEQIRLSGWATLEENISRASSVSSCRSSSDVGREKSLSCITSKNATVSSKRLIVPQKPTDCLTKMEEKEISPVSVQDPWLSGKSSPSTNSSLGNAV